MFLNGSSSLLSPPHPPRRLHRSPSALKTSSFFSRCDLILFSILVIIHKHVHSSLPLMERCQLHPNFVQTRWMSENVFMTSSDRLTLTTARLGIDCETETSSSCLLAAATTTDTGCQRHLSSDVYFFVVVPDETAVHVMVQDW